MILHRVTQLLLVTAQQAAEHGEAAHAAEKGKEAFSTHLPNFLTFISESFAHHFEVPFFALLISLILVVGAGIVYSRRQMIPGPAQNFVEMIVEGLYNLIYMMLGKDTRRYLPFLGTLFVYIWCMNMAGIVPFFHAPTSSISTTAALAICTFLYVQFTALTRLGPGKYLYHLAGEPTSAVTWVLVIINLPLHVFGEFVKPFSLAVRLFGNITGEDTLIAVMVSLGVMALSFISPSNPIGIPFQLPFYFLSLLLGTIQALVFAMLSAAYILMVLPHEEHEH
jgi:F-type H+-transporting ATPase subunit a